MSLRTCMAAQGLAGAIEPGLRALGSNSIHVTVKKPSTSIESINLDAALNPTLPHDPRWDYGVGFVRGAIAHTAWIEVHSANSSHIDDFLAKLAWLKTRLAATSCRQNTTFHWVATGAVAIDRQKRLRLASAGVKGPTKKLVL